MFFSILQQYFWLFDELFTSSAFSFEILWWQYVSSQLSVVHWYWRFVWIMLNHCFLFQNVVHFFLWFPKVMAYQFQTQWSEKVSHLEAKTITKITSQPFGPGWAANIPRVRSWTGCAKMWNFFSPPALKLVCYKCTLLYKP